MLQADASNMAGQGGAGRHLATVAEGGVTGHPAVHGGGSKHITPQGVPAYTSGGMTRADYLAELAVLSKRECEVLVHVAKGFGTPEIAALLEMSPHTVAWYRKTMAQKLGVNMYAACVLAAHAGIA